MSIIVKPYNGHNLIIDDIYELEVHLFNKYNHIKNYYLNDFKYKYVYIIFSHNQSINIGSNAKVVMNLPEDYFKVLSTVNNGSYVLVKPIKLGTPKIEASLVKPYHDSRSSNRITVSIYSRIKVVPDIVVFPWHANQNSG